MSATAPNGWSRTCPTYLDERFRGESLATYSRTKPKPKLPLYHLVGALDALTDGDVKERLQDGLPNTSGEWIMKDQLTHLKVKLNGTTPPGISNGSWRSTGSRRPPRRGRSRTRSTSTSSARTSSISSRCSAA
jgi:hypothetical protein